MPIPRASHRTKKGDPAQQWRTRSCARLPRGEAKSTALARKLCYEKKGFMRSRLPIAGLPIWLAVVACNARDDVGSQQSLAPSRKDTANPPEHLAMVVAPPTGDVKAIVREMMKKAGSESRRLVVYVGAPWCEPCRRLHEAATRGELDSTFANVMLLEFDMDRDGERLKEAGYGSQYIPLFALPAEDGGASGRRIEGAIKGDGAVAFVVPRLARLLAP
jgi:thiol-disulfide isomerase/thioredoxin